MTQVLATPGDTLCILFLVHVNVCGVEAGGHSEPLLSQRKAKIFRTVKWKLFP